MFARLFLICVFAVGGGVVIAPTADAQNILDRARRAAERGAERAVEREAQRRADRAVTGAIECVAGDRKCAEEARAEGQEVTYVDQDGEPVPDQEAAEIATEGAPATTQPAAPAPGEGAWANYDFVPGERVLFYDDFSGDIIGRFPRRLNFEGGMMEVVEWEGKTLLRSTDNSSVFRINLPETLPDRFTIEFDAYFQSRRLNDRLMVSTFEHDRRRAQNASHSIFYLSPRTAGVRGPIESTANPSLHEREMVAVRIAVDGPYATMYLNERRVANLPNADIPRSDFVQIHLGMHSEPSYIGDLRIAAGGREMMYDRLMADGRVATHGVLFDTGSANIRPESTPTLQDIARMLNQHGSLRLRIEGHTDSVGDAAANQRLSEQRAQAVVNHLIQREGVSATRLQAVGLGEAQPVADNSTAEGRQTNRRVELVVMD